MPLWTRIPHLDRRETLTGSLVNSITFWTLTQQDSTIDAVVLADTAFGATEGTVLQVGNAGGIYVYINGDYTAGSCVVGRLFDASLTLSKVFLRDQQGLAQTQGELLLRDMTVVHRHTGEYKTKASYSTTNRTVDRSETFSAASFGVEEDGREQMTIETMNDEVTLTIENNTARPSTIASVEFEADWTDMSK